MIKNDEIDFKRLKPVFEDDRPVAIDETLFSSEAPRTPVAPEAAPEGWDEETLTRLSLEERIGQLLWVSQLPDLDREIAEFHIGGVVFLGNGRRAADIAELIDHCQARSPLPMVFGIDSEAGLGARVADATAFPSAMALGAAGDPMLTAAVARVMATESRALGINLSASPTLDVNTEPRNPVIALRSYGDDPVAVARHGNAVVDAARAAGVATILKHYPGHGAADGDSHNSLPCIDITREALESIHAEPFRRVIAETAPDYAMSCHIWYPAIHPEKPWPATLSREINVGLLREKLGFRGVLVSDSFEMDGAALAVPDEGERAVVGIESGLDVILQAQSAEGVYTGLLNAVKSGRLSEERINESVRRVLAAKARAGLYRRPDPAGDAWRGVLRHPAHRAIARRVAERAFTRVRGGGIATGERFLLLDLQASLKQFFRFSSDTFVERLKALGADFEHVKVPAGEEAIGVGEILSHPERTIVVAGFDSWRINAPAQVELIRAFAAAGRRVVYTSFGTPYHLMQVPEVDSFFCGFGSLPVIQEVAAEVLLGRREAVGRLPVTVQGA